MAQEEAQIRSVEEIKEDKKEEENFKKLALDPRWLIVVVFFL